MNNLENIIKTNAEEYYTTGKQELSDDVFDAVVDKLREENPDSDILTTGWGYKPIESGDKIRHKYGHIGSLNKAHNFKEICNELGIDTLACVDISAKLDGMSVVLYYEKGKLVLALTRGDGEYGINITDKVKILIGGYINDDNFTGAVRGEILMCPAEFEEFKKYHPEAKNHRNSAIGIINSIDITDDFKYLKLYLYSVVGSDENRFSFIQNNTIWLKDNFKYVAPRVIAKISAKDCESQLLDYKDIWEKYVNIDGIVISRTLTKYHNNGEITQISCAFKFQDEVKITKVINVSWEMSKHQAYIPVVNIEPIELEGTTVRKVTGYNAKWIKDMYIRTGCLVAVCKANQIIPKIVEVFNQIEV